MSLPNPAAVVVPEFGALEQIMIGEKALRLIKDLVAGSPDFIPPYEYAMVDTLVEEMQRNFQLNQEQA